MKVTFDQVSLHVCETYSNNNNDNYLQQRQIIKQFTQLLNFTLVRKFVCSMEPC